MTFIAISQATNRTPSCRACASSSGREVTFWRAITPFIIAVPMPAMFIFESASFDAPFGSIQPNIRPKMSFCTAGF